MEEQNKEILDKFDLLLDEVKKTNEYQNYLLLKDKLNKNIYIKDKIKKIKALQKECVKKEYRKISTTSLEKELTDELKILEDIPIYKEYTYVVSDLNYIINYIKDEIEDIVNENI